ncbi:MAG: sigma-54 dependent transcriptional regulator [Desulfobulbaceae bacterium]|nr:sigma-54 dependent transcriptional regulator [Desulfobulbaceae bacterium]
MGDQNDWLHLPLKRVLVVDDEPDMLALLTRLLEKKCGYETRRATNADKAMEQISFWRPDVVLTDIRMPGIDGMDFFRRLKEIDPTITVIIMTGYGTVEMAVKAMKDGVFDFFEKPFDNDQIVFAVSRAMEHTELLREQRRFRELQHQMAGSFEFHGFIGSSPKLLQMQDLLRRIAPSCMTVLIRGESGTGKELAARALHAMSNRAERRMVIVNCPALPEHILESELFGYARGAFTGAERDKDGLFLEANGSTILLDEVADIPISIQTKLLRVLQEKEIQPLGQNRAYEVDVRVISSTNQDIEAKIARGEFREDLFYRLNVMTVTMPHIEEIRADIPLLINHFLKRYRAEHGRPDLELSEEALHALAHHHFRGNVRELQNVINRAVLLGSGKKIRKKDLMLDDAAAVAGAASPVFFEQLHTLPYSEAKETMMREFTRSFFSEHLRQSGGNITAAARRCGMERQALQRLLRRYQIASPIQG